jgi:hypothetical protein
MPASGGNPLNGEPLRREASAHPQFFSAEEATALLIRPRQMMPSEFAWLSSTTRPSNR